MAKALQCPSCGTKKRLDALADGASFRCEQCGKVLKVPPGLSGRPGATSSAQKPAQPPAQTPAPAPGPVRQPAASGGAPPPAPRRRSRPPMSAGGAAAGAGGTAVLASPPPVVGPGIAPPVVAPPRGSTSDDRPVRGSGAEGGRGEREALPLPLRALAWLVALPLGLAIVGLPARKAGYLSSQKLLNVIVKSDLTRFVPIVVIIVLWALVSALLVTLFVEGGRRLMVRHHQKQATRGSAASSRAAGSPNVRS